MAQQNFLLKKRKKGGKIYIAELFAKENYKSYILIDFNKVSKSFLHTPYVIHTEVYREDNVPIYMTPVI